MADDGTFSPEVKSIVDSFDKAVARFHPRYLHALEPLIRASQDNVLRWSTAGLIVEPVASGGVLLVTTDGGSLAAIHDAAGRATRPMRLTIPDALFDAVTAPAGVSMFDQGTTFAMDLPEWAQPGEVYAWGLAAYVLPKMPHPHFRRGDDSLLASVGAEEGNTYAGGYRIHKEPPTLDWRRIFAADRVGIASHINFYPDRLDRFSRIERLSHGKGLEIAIAGPTQALILTVPGLPEFVGAMMPNSTPIEAAALPDWARPAPGRDGDGGQHG